MISTEFPKETIWKLAGTRYTERKPGRQGARGTLVKPKSRTMRNRPYPSAVQCRVNERPRLACLTVTVRFRARGMLSVNERLKKTSTAPAGACVSRASRTQVRSHTPPCNPALAPAARQPHEEARASLATSTSATLPPASPHAANAEPVRCKRAQCMV